jgi:hypothetical protein
LDHCNSDAQLKKKSRGLEELIQADSRREWIAIVFTDRYRGAGAESVFFPDSISSAMSFFGIWGNRDARCR